MKPSKFKKLNWSDFVLDNTNAADNTSSSSSSSSVVCVRLDAESLATIEIAERVLQDATVLVCKITDDLVDTESDESQNRVAVLEVEYFSTCILVSTFQFTTLFLDSSG
jgi:hypothetical protein